MKWLTSIAFQLFLYSGSRVPHTAYEPIVSNVRRMNHNVNVTFVDGSFLQCRSPLRDIDDKKDGKILLMGHSFGGYFALLDAQRYPQKVSAVILLNSHFNSRLKAPYPSIPQGNMDIPVFTILGGKDERLTPRTALDDMFESIRNQYRNKFYVINPAFDHFAGMVQNGVEPNQSDVFVLANQITTFAKDVVDDQHFRKTMRMCRPLRSRYEYDLYKIAKGNIVVNRPLGVVDALLKFVLPSRTWTAIRWLLFVSSKPIHNHMSFLYEHDDCLYLKASASDSYLLKNELIRWTRKALPIDNIINVDVQSCVLPSVHPSILLWLGLPTVIRHSTDTISLSVIELQINENITYYKIPHPERIYDTILSKNQGYIP